VKFGISSINASDIDFLNPRWLNCDQLGSDNSRIDDCAAHINADLFGSFRAAHCKFLVPAHFPCQTDRWGTLYLLPLSGLPNALPTRYNAQVGRLSLRQHNHPAELWNRGPTSPTVRRCDGYSAGASIPFSTVLMNPLATWPVTSMRCSRIASEPPNPPRSLLAQPVIRCARMRKSSAVRVHRR
jgi:hypothetical protein